MIRFFILFFLVISVHVFASHAEEYEMIQQVDLKCFLLAQKAMKAMIETEELKELDASNYLLKKFKKINCFHHGENIIIQFQYPIIANREWEKILDAKNYSYEFDSESFEILERNYD